MKRIVMFFAMIMLALSLQIEAQVNWEKEVGGWRIDGTNNLSFAELYLDTAKETNPRYGGFVEGNGSLRIKSTRKDGSKKQIISVHKNLSKTYDFPKKVGFARRIVTSGPANSELISITAQVDVYIPSGKYFETSSFPISTGVFQNSLFWDAIYPSFAFELQTQSTEKVAAVSIVLKVNADTLDVNLDWLAFWYEPSPTLPDHGIKVDSFEGEVTGVRDNPPLINSFTLFLEYRILSSLHVAYEQVCKLFLYLD